jgi:hypothetical protein
LGEGFLCKEDLLKAASIEINLARQSQKVIEQIERRNEWLKTGEMKCD